MVGKRLPRQDSLFSPVRRETRVSRELAAIKSVLDFGVLREEAAKKFAADGVGRPSIPPETLLAIVFLGFWFNIPSDRELCEEIEDRLSFRDFVGIADDAGVPVHSSLTHWRQRLGKEFFQKFLTITIEAAIKAGLKPGRCRVFDSTLTKADATLGSNTIKIELQEDANLYLDAMGEWTNRTEPTPGNNDDDQESPPTSGGAENSAATSNDRVQQKNLAKGKPITLNLHDPDARLLSRQGKNKAFYHKCHFGFDSKTSLALHADAGHIFEPDKMTEFLANEQHPVDTVAADTGYYSAKSQKWLERRGITAHISVRDNRSLGRTFGLDAFTYLEETDCYVCPEGKILTRQGATKDGEIRYATPKNSCASCPLQIHCFQPGRLGNRRQISITPEGELANQARARNRTHRYHRLKRLRSIVCEGGIASMKRYGGLGRARWLGEEAMGIQALMAAAVYNIKKILKYQEQLAASALKNALQPKIRRYLRPIRALLSCIFPKPPQLHRLPVGP